MLKKLIFPILLLSSSNTLITQFMEVPTPTAYALYSGCIAQGANGFPYVWVCGASGIVYKGRVNVTTLNWINVSGNLSNMLNLVTLSAIDSSIAFVGGNIGTTTYIYKTTNGGANWLQQFSQPNGRINAVWMRNSLSGFAAGNPVGGRWSLFRTTNGGSNWDSTGRFLPSASNETGFNNSLWCIRDTVIFGTSNTRTYFSSNHGASWVVQTTSPEVNITSIYWDFMPYPEMRMFAAGSNCFLNSSNYGMNWIVQQNVPGTGNIPGVCSFTPGVHSPVDFEDIYCRGNKIYISYYGSWIWNQYYTAPSGNYTYLFQKRNEPPPAYQGFGPIVGTRDNGGVTICFGCRWGVIRRLGNEVPVSYVLYQNYPNPFNPATGIKFSVPKNSFINISIYNVLGEKVQVILEENVLPGEYEVEFDGTNYPSGIYYYTLSTTNFIETKKMALIK